MLANHIHVAIGRVTGTIDVPADPDHPSYVKDVESNAAVVLTSINQASCQFRQPDRKRRLLDRTYFCCTADNSVSDSHQTGPAVSPPESCSRQISPTRLSEHHNREPRSKRTGHRGAGLRSRWRRRDNDERQALPMIFDGVRLHTPDRQAACSKVQGANRARIDQSRANRHAEKPQAHRNFRQQGTNAS